MTNIIKIQDYLLANETPDPTKRMANDNQDALTLENQKLLSEVMTHQDNIQHIRVLSASLKIQLKALLMENDTLLSALKADDAEALAVVPTDTTSSESKQNTDSQSLYCDAIPSIKKQHPSPRTTEH